MEEVGIGEEQLEEMEKKEVRKLCRDRNNSEWRRGMEEKRSLKFYRNWKKRMGKMRRWRSGRKDRIVKMYQSGSILTRSRMGETEEEKRCTECGVKEDLEHLVMSCRRFSRLREEEGVNGRNMEEILFGGYEDFLMRLETERLVKNS